MPDASTDTRLGRRLVLDELFDLSLYRALHRVAPADQRAILEQLIPIETRHRLENPGTAPLVMIEVQCGGYLGEDDIVRFDDKYGRAPA